MNWYMAKLIFQVRSDGAINTPHVDEQWRLIQADEVTWAFEKASVLGRLDENSFFQSHNEMPVRKFVEVADVHLIGSLEDGAMLL